MQREIRPAADARAFLALLRLCRRERFHVVHTHCAKAGFLGRLAARRAGVPAVLHTPHCFPFQRVDTRLTPLYRVLERRAARWADRIVLVGESQRQVALDAGVCEEEELVVVENGIAPPAEEPAALRRRHREALGLSEDAWAAGFVGRVTPQKDVQTFLSACDALLASLPDLALLLVGTTDHLPYLRSLRPPISPEAWRVVARGGSPDGPVYWSSAMPIRVLGERSEASELIAALDVLVLPSRYEGLPYVALEAMACGVPVVASEVPGNVDAVADGETGLLVESGRASSFARAVAKLLADADLRRTMGAAARRRVAARFTQERFLREMAALYEAERRS